MQQLEWFLQKYTRPNQLSLMLSTNICLGSFVLGYEFSVYTPCQNSVSFANNWMNNPDKHFIHGVLNASLPLGVIIGILITNLIINLKMRMIFIINDLLTISAILYMNQKGFNEFLMGRFVLGLTLGVNQVFIPIYIDQMTNKHMKGLCGSLNSCFYQAGFLFSFFMGYLLPTETDLEHGINTKTYKYILTWPILLCFLRITILTSIFSLETPLDYLKRGQTLNAQKLLQLIQKDSLQFQMNIDNIKDQQSISFYQLFTQRYYRQVLLGISYAALQPLSGINIVIFYSQQFFQDFSESNQNLLTLWIGISLVFSALISGSLVNILGRKKLTILGIIICMLNLLLLSLSNYIHNYKITVINIYFFILSYGLSLGPVFSIYISEILPIKGVWFSVLINWFVQMLIGLFFPKMYHTFGLVKLFLCFAIIQFLALFLFQYSMVETNLKTQEQINKEFTGSELYQEINNKQE